MGLPRNVRLNKRLKSKIAKYLKRHDVTFSRLISMAIDKFISESRPTELVPIKSQKWKRATRKAAKKHKHAMQKLK